MNEKHPRFKLLTEQIDRRKAMIETYRSLEAYWSHPMRKSTHSAELINTQVEYTRDKEIEHQEMLFNYESELDAN